MSLINRPEKYFPVIFYVLSMDIKKFVLHVDNMCYIYSVNVSNKCICVKQCFQKCHMVLEWFTVVYLHDTFILRFSNTWKYIACSKTKCLLPTIQFDYILFIIISNNFHFVNTSTDISIRNNRNAPCIFKNILR